jgi:superfamily I DNA/RNA helicase
MATKEKAGRAVVVGDPNQSLYRFRGADSQAFPRIAAMLEGNGRPLKRLALPVNYRCDDYIIRHAQQWVPELRGAKKANGTVDVISFGDAIDRSNNNNTDIALRDSENGALRTLPVSGRKEVSFAFLCRVNLPLIITAYKLIGEGKRVCIIGRNQIGQPLKSIIQELCGSSSSEADFTNRISDKLGDHDITLEEGLLTRLANFHRIQAAKLRDEKYERKLEALEQNVQCIEVICERVQDDKVSSVVEEIDNLFTEEPTPGVISLSTIHRAKGLEWDVLFVLRPDLMPHPLAKPNSDGSWSDEQQQEQNAQYVCGTRARSRLYYVHNWPFDNKTQGGLVFEYPDEAFGEKRDERFSSPATVAKQLDVEHQPSLSLDGFVDDGNPF